MAFSDHIAYYSIGLALAIVWVGVLVALVGICRSAARGDRALVDARASLPSARTGRLRLVA